MLAERHTVFFERLLQEPQRFRPDAVQLLQLGDRHVRELAEPGIPGGGERASCRCPNVPGNARIWCRHVLQGNGGAETLQRSDGLLSDDGSQSAARRPLLRVEAVAPQVLRSQIARG